MSAEAIEGLEAPQEPVREPAAAVIPVPDPMAAENNALLASMAARIADLEEQQRSAATMQDLNIDEAKQRFNLDDRHVEGLGPDGVNAVRRIAATVAATVRDQMRAEVSNTVAQERQRWQRESAFQAHMARAVGRDWESIDASESFRNWVRDNGFINALRYGYETSNGTTIAGIMRAFLAATAPRRSLEPATPPPVEPAESTPRFLVPGGDEAAAMPPGNGVRSVDEEPAPPTFRQAYIDAFWVDLGKGAPEMRKQGYTPDRIAGLRQQIVRAMNEGRVVP